MDKIRRIPHEGVKPADTEDGLEATDTDTEGHRRKSGDGVINRGPGTGGDAFPRRPSGGGELIDENDVEGHGMGNDVIARGPGTGGDFSPPRRPGSGELIDDTDVTGR
jgi:hypothetical protein